MYVMEFTNPDGGIEHYEYAYVSRLITDFNDFIQYEKPFTKIEVFIK